VSGPVPASRRGGARAGRRLIEGVFPDSEQVIRGAAAAAHAAGPQGWRVRMRTSR